MWIGITNIRIVSKYETKLLVRGWFFKVFAFLALFAAVILGSMYILSQYQQPQMVNRSVIPYMFMLVMNVGQAVVSVFLASEYLKRDKQLDTSEIFYTRPLSNAEYLLGKMCATLKVFFILDIIVALIALIMSLIKYGFDLDYVSYIWYFLLLCVPTLVFIVGLSTTLMLLLNNQAITMVILLAYIGVTLFYIDNVYYYLFDYIGFNLPMIKSVITGFSGLPRLINHRLCYLLLGIGLIFSDVSLFHRLANSKFSLLPWRIATAVFLIGGLYAGYRAVGAWYDAGDFDIQSGTVIGMTNQLAEVWDVLRPERDETFIDQKTQFVDIHRPDGLPDMIQQVEHGALNLCAQIENIGFIAGGIVQGNMHQYHHLGDAVTITDGYMLQARISGLTLSPNSNTSRPAPQMRFSLSASARASSSTIGPRAVLTRMAVGFISSICSFPMRCHVSLE